MKDSYLLEREGIKDFPLDSYCRTVGINKKELCRRVGAAYVNLMRWQADNLLPRAFVLKMLHKCGSHGFDQKGKLTTPPRPWRLPMDYSQYVQGSNSAPKPQPKAPPPIAEVLRIPTEMQLRAAHEASTNGKPEPAPTPTLPSKAEHTAWQEVVEILLQMSLTAQRGQDRAEEALAAVREEVARLRQRNQQLEEEIQVANELMQQPAAAPTPPKLAVLEQLAERQPNLRAAVQEVVARGKSRGS